MSTFSERYSAARPSRDVAPLDLRDDIMRVLERFVESGRLHVILARHAHITVEAARTRRVAHELDWRAFYDVVEDLIAGLAAGDRVSASGPINAAFNAYDMPWMLTVDGWIVDVPGKSAVSGLRRAQAARGSAAHTHTDDESAHAPVSSNVPLLSEAPSAEAAPLPGMSADVSQESHTSAVSSPPWRLPDQAIALPGVFLVVAVTCEAVPGLDATAAYWLWVVAAWLLVVTVAAGIHVTVASRARGRRLAIVNQTLMASVVTVGVGAIIAGAAWQPRDDATGSARKSSESRHTARPAPSASTMPVPTPTLTDEPTPLATPVKTPFPIARAVHGDLKTVAEQIGNDVLNDCNDGYFEKPQRIYGPAMLVVIGRLERVPHGDEVFIGENSDQDCYALRDEAQTVLRVAEHYL